MHTFTQGPTQQRSSATDDRAFLARNRIAPPKLVPVISPSPLSLQAKLTTGTAYDLYEREADRVAGDAMRMPEPQPESDCACGGACSKCQTEQQGREQARLQTKHVGGAGELEQAAAPPIVNEVLRSSGQTLDHATRARMETRFGHDFSKVRVHTGERAAKSAAAINALAYTVGDQIVFGAGQHAPATSSGQRLLAHELAHVVQQSGGQALHGESAGQHGLSPAPTGLIARKQGPLSDQEEAAEEERKHPKNRAVRLHIEQQRHVADLLEKAKKLQPDPKKGLRDADNLFHNTAQLLDAGRFTLTILTPTHYSRDDRPVFFDLRKRYPEIGGDYPEDPKVRDSGLDFPPPGRAGQATPGPSIPQIQTLSGKPIGQPSTPSLEASNVLLHIAGDSLISEGNLRNTFVHEGQHVADLSQLPLKDTTLSESQHLLELYKTEFRAFWIQPPVPFVCTTQPFCPIPTDPMQRLHDTGLKAINSRKVNIASRSCTRCPAPPSASGKSAPTEATTGLQDMRQEEIFWYLIDNYPQNEFDCCYVSNPDFKKEVDAFTLPASANLINSPRLMDLSAELIKLNPSMAMDAVAKTKFFVALGNLDALDWNFLKDEKLSKPFWDALKTNAPKFINDRMKDLVKKATAQGVSVVEIESIMSVKLRPESKGEPPPK